MVDLLDDPIEELRQIRRLMDGSRRYSNFSAASCVWAGGVSLGAAFLQSKVVSSSPLEFLALWIGAIVVALGGDLLMTRGRITAEEKAVLVRMRQPMLRAVAPGLFAGVVLTSELLARGRMTEIYPLWLLLYGVILSAAATHSTRELRWLSLALLAVGASAVTLQFTLHLGTAFGLGCFALSFGLGHVGYGAYVGSREGW